MPSPIRSAVAIAKTALAAVDWVAVCSEPVEVSSIPEQEAKNQLIEEKCLVHVSAEGNSRSFVTRGVIPLVNSVTLVVSVCRYIPPDDAGFVDEVLLARCEGVLDKACVIVCEAIRDSGTYALLSPIEQPEEYQRDLIRSGIYWSALVFNLRSGGGA